MTHYIVFKLVGAHRIKGFFFKLVVKFDAGKKSSCHKNSYFKLGLNWLRWLSPLLAV